jgi:cyclophilin family peptidyl-prolyl cis-trans isomerase
VPKATKRERQRQNKEARRAAMQEAEKRHKRNRTIRNLVLLLIPLVIIFVVLQLTKSDDSKATKNDKSSSNLSAPKMTIDPTATYTATMDTSEGTIVIALDAAQYPKSVNNFVYLAKKKFYDGLLFNRVAKDFVIQTGSPNNTQAGGPGYSVVGEVPTIAPSYPVGAVAFGNGGGRPAGTAGSQFFIVTGSSNPDLPADYAGIGTVSQGLDVAQAIGQLFPSSGDGPPTKKVTIKTITITEAPGTSTTTTAASTTSTTTP